MRGSGLVGFVLGASTVVLLGSLTPVWGDAQKTDPGQGNRQSQKEVSLTEGVIVIPSDEDSTKELSQSRERPLSIPGAVIDGSTTQLRTPDANDIDNARESDAESAMSY